MGIFKKPSSSSNPASEVRKRDPYVTGNPNDWNRRDKNDGETFRKPKGKK